MEQPNRYRFVIQILVTLVRICVGLIWAAAGPLLPYLMNEFNISRGSAGWYASAAPIAVVAMAVPIGIIGAKYSLKKTFALGAFLQAASILIPLFSSYEMVILTRVLFALGTAITVPLATAILSEWFSPRELPLVNGITISFVSLGNAVAYTATIPIATILSWRYSIFIYGAFALTCALAWLIFGREQKNKKPLVQLLGKEVLSQSGMSIKQAITRKSTIYLALGVMGAWCLGNAIGSWLPTYYHEVFKMPLAKASSLTALATAAGVAASIVGGMLSMRIGKRRPFLMISGIFMGTFALISILFNVPAVIFVSVVLFGLFGNLHNASIYTIPMELANVNARTGAVVFSFMLAAGNFGNFMGPLIVGYGRDLSGSYLPGFIICAVLSLGLFAAGLLIPETGPGGKKF
jgi:MFS transporter, NNP family, nitrate/nitrite transporter